MNAKQALSYMANRCTEEEAARLLENVKFSTDGKTFLPYNGAFSGDTIVYTEINGQRRVAQATVQKGLEVKDVPLVGGFYGQRKNVEYATVLSVQRDDTQLIFTMSGPVGDADPADFIADTEDGTDSVAENVDVDGVTVTATFDFAVIDGGNYTIKKLNGMWESATGVSPT